MLGRGKFYFPWLGQPDFSLVYVLATCNIQSLSRFILYIVDTLLLLCLLNLQTPHKMPISNMRKCCCSRTILHKLLCLLAGLEVGPCFTKQLVDIDSYYYNSLLGAQLTGTGPDPYMDPSPSYSDPNRKYIYS